MQKNRRQEEEIPYPWKSNKLEKNSELPYLILILHGYLIKVGEQFN